MFRDHKQKFTKQISGEGQMKANNELAFEFASTTDQSILKVDQLLKKL